MTTPDRLRSAATIAATDTTDHAELGEFACLVGGQWRKTSDVIEVRSPYDGQLVALVHRAGAAEVEQAIAAATRSFQVTRKLPVWKRAEVLEKISAGIGIGVFQQR